MPFISTKENGGKPDPNVNRRGRPLKGDEKTLTRREAKDKENLILVRKLKPIAQRAIKQLQKIVDDPSTSEAGRLKASDMIMKYFLAGLDNLYAPSRADELPEDQTNVEDVQPDNRPVFSLKIIGNDEQK